MTERGRFICFEGVEGVGKTTNMQFVGNWLTLHGISYVSTREPGGTILGEEVREVLLKHRDEPLCNDAEQLLFFAARAQHIQQVILPNLQQGNWVVCDRFTDASYAYQGGGRGMPMERIAFLEEWVQGGLRPDLVIVLDMPVELGLSRARGRGQAADRIEKEHVAFFERVRDVYLQRAKAHPERYVVVDATRTLDLVQQDISNALLDRVEITV